jgi:hypothetical protein
MVEVEDGIDDGAVQRVAVPDQIADGVGGLVEEGPDRQSFGLGHDRLLWLAGRTRRLILDIYMSDT